MEESEYKSKYNELTPVRCVFEKALTNNRAKCGLSNHFWLADREGYACNNIGSSVKCSELLKKLRENSIFVLKLKAIDGPLPHNMEIRVQVGGLSGLVKQLQDESETGSTQWVTEDINALINMAVEQFGSMEKLPYSEIMQSVVQFQGRQRRQR